MDPDYHLERLRKVGQMLYGPLNSSCVPTITSLLIWQGTKRGRHTGYYIVYPGTPDKLLRLAKLDTDNWAEHGAQAYDDVSPYYARSGYNLPETLSKRVWS